MDITFISKDISWLHVFSKAPGYPTVAWLQPWIHTHTCHSWFIMSVPWLRCLVAGLSPFRSTFIPRPVHVGYVVAGMTLQQVFQRVLPSSPVSIIPPMLHVLSFIHQCYVMSAICSVVKQHTWKSLKETQELTNCRYIIVKINKPRQSVY